MHQKNKKGARTPLFSFIASIILTFCTIMSGCGHKQRSVVYAPAAPKQTFSKLMFPAPQTIVAQQTANGNIISWQPLIAPPKTSLIGYQLFRITRKKCVPRKPIVSVPCLQTSVCDHEKDYHNVLFYLMRGIFQEGSFVIEGPLSKMVPVPH